MKIYTLQVNKHGNLIICRASQPRHTYTIVKSGSYNELLAIKATKPTTTTTGHKTQ